MSDPIPTPSRHHIWRLTKRTLVKSWDDSIFAESAQAAFWSALSMPPLLLGLLGSLAYVAPLFGPDTMHLVEERLVTMAHSFFSPSVVNEIIVPTITDIDKGARGEVVSLGFLISLWAGSSAVSAFVDSVVEAHGQTPLRHPVRQRFFALLLYVVALVFVIVTAPFMSLGPRKIAELIPAWGRLLHFGYYPAVIAALLLAIMLLYRVSLPRPLPSHRLVIGSVLATVVFLLATLGLRVYLTWITSTGYTYGALATPIAFLLFAFFGGFAIMVGAELNAAIQEQWPAPTTHTDRLRGWLRSRAQARAAAAAAQPDLAPAAQRHADPEAVDRVSPS